MFKKITFVLLLLIALLFTRVYNLDHTARFTRDESSDLAHMHWYYKDKKISLVGPISNNNEKVFGSLTYYMYMPFAAAGNFEPISPVYGAVFWGVATALVMLLLVKKLNKQLLPFAVILAIVWYPLLQTSRWAWNPHLVIFWIALGLWFYLRGGFWSYLLAGISFGLSFHNHYISLFVTSVFIFIASILFLKKREFKNILLLAGGYVLTFVPFILFDLRHPPGLFFNKFLLHGSSSAYHANSLSAVALNISHNVDLFMFYITQNIVLAVILGLLFLGLLIYDFFHNRKAFIYVIPVIVHLILSAFIDEPLTRFLLPALFFTFVWIILPRKLYGATITKMCMVVLVIGGLLSVYPQLHYSDVQPDLTTVSKVNHFIADTTKKEHLPDVNIAVVQSPDFDPVGSKYRDLLSMANITLRAPIEYDATANLFVVSTASEASLRKGKDLALQVFQNSKLMKEYPIENTPWKVYLFHR